MPFNLIIPCDRPHVNAELSFRPKGEILDALLVAAGIKIFLFIFPTFEKGDFIIITSINLPIHIKDGKFFLIRFYHVNILKYPVCI